MSPKQATYHLPYTSSPPDEPLINSHSLAPSDMAGAGQRGLAHIRSWPRTQKDKDATLISTC